MFPSFVDVILRHAAHDALKPAIGTESGVLSYGQLAQAVAAAISASHKAGIGKGDVVGLIVSDPVWQIALICALYRVGAVSISINAREAGIDLGMTAILHDRDRPENFAGPCHAVDPDWFTLQSRDFDNLPNVPRAGNELCRVALSSGTTGVPKPIAMSPEILWHRLTTYMLRGRFSLSEKILCGPQMRSHFGFAIAFSALFSGKMVCFSDSADVSLPIISYYGVDLAVISVHQLTELADVQSRQFGGLSSLREIQAGGATISGRLYSRVRSAIACPILNTYASTEAGTAALGSIDMLGEFREKGCVGILAPWARVTACDENGNERPADTSGTLKINTIGMAPTYVPGMTHVEEPDHFFPGDVGFISGKRFLFIEGRDSELINIGGNKVAPGTIEKLVMECSGVKEAAAFAVKTTSDLPQICVFVVTDGPFDPGDVIRHCTERSRVITPTVVRVVDELPRNETGKIMYDRLRKQVTGEQA